MICRSGDIFYRFGNDQILSKMCGWNKTLWKQKTTKQIMPDTLHKKPFLMVYIGTYDCYENIKIKLWSTISILKPWHVEIFRYKNKMIAEFNYIL